MIDTLRAAVRTWRAEGPAAVRDRFLDRWSETRQTLRLTTSAGRAWPAAPILNVSGVPVAARGGGVPLQLRARLVRERPERAVALLSRQARGGFRLDGWSEDRLHATRFPASGWNGDPLTDEPGWIDTIRAASALVGARAIHIENLAGLSLPSLLALARRDLPLIVSMHDFGAFCRRSHLWCSSGGFCDYSIDEPRCRRCLAASPPPFTIDQPRHRALAADLLSAAAAVICPSQFLGDRLAELIAWRGDDSREVIAPGVDYVATPFSARRPDQAAFIGGGADHKGGARLPALARALATRGVAVTVYGGNGPHHLMALRALANVRVRGYVRAGSLPALLARQGAAVALLLPGVPESFSLTLSDAWAAGVPVVAPAQGALVERFETGGGCLLTADPSDDEVVSALDRWRQRPIGLLPRPSTAADAAARHLALYRRRGWMSDA